jgi:hypothetical protein
MLTLPDLHSPHGFQAWFLGQRKSQTSPDSIIDSLKELCNDISSLRAVCTSYWSGVRDDFWPLADQALTHKDPVVVAYAKSLVSYQHIVNSHAQGDEGAFSGAVDLVPALENSLGSLLQLPRTDLLSEAEASLRICLALANILCKRFDVAAGHASEALFWAKQIRAPITEARARAQLISSHGNAGKIVDTVVLIKTQTQDSPMLLVQHQYQQIVLASLLSYLGAVTDCRKILLDLLTECPTPKILAALQRVESFWGVGSLEGEVAPDLAGTSPRAWMVQAMRGLMVADSLPRMNQFQTERDRHLFETVEVCREVSSLVGPRAIGMKYWISAKAYQGLGKLALAQSQVFGFREENKEALDLRILFAGLRLELSLSPYLPDLSPTTAEQELREVFADAALIPHASRSGLAQLLQRWHPVAAAYAAVMPEPIPELEFATQAILESGERCQVYGLPMPPVYAVELILRSLGLDSRKDRGFTQAPLNKREIAQRDALTSNYGAVPYWRPVVTGMQLVFGLTKAGQGRYEYAQAAQRVIQGYGLLPQSKSGYAQYELGLIHTGLQGLTSGALSAQDFARMLYRS